MEQKTFLKIASIIFGIVAIGHLLRVASSWSLVIENFAVPMWASYLAVILIGYMGYQGCKLAKANK